MKVKKRHSNTELIKRKTSVEINSTEENHKILSK